MSRISAGARWAAHGLLLAGIAGIGTPGLGVQAQEPFPHQEHEGLFPLCTGCHQGVPSDAEATAFPEPALCVRCHDGVDQERVDWTGPEADVNNLRFRHQRHTEAAAQAGEGSLECRACHTPPGPAPEGAVARHPEEGCLGCHAHERESHYQDQGCETCHVTLAETRFSARQIQDLPVPDEHGEAEFLPESHGAMVRDGPARCATCHTRDRCAACHVDATREEITALALAPPSMELPEFGAEYPVPASHRDPAFLEAHGGAARNGAGAECATCHTRDDCASCHLAPLPDAARALSLRSAVQAPGVGVEVTAPPSHASPWFLDQHEARAAADEASCASCHTRTFCTDCHEGPPGDGFHPDDFLARHPTEAYAQRLECASCHSTQVFCRQCHLESGFESRGRLGPGFHDAEPVWLFRHPQAARQSLETCQSCHSQRDCLQCHSTTGAFRVSPHGPDFDAQAAWDRNPTICFACHLSSPLGGGGP
ncbi:MAG TPA: hypothetical protein VLL48_09050 [Longimicrobiales bacterium]|nr:hypothetical protein [Longimicrobiales bacterium]